MFKKGQSGNIKGRGKGVLNNPDVMSIKTLLEDAFLRNRSAAIARVDKMFQGEDNADFKFLLSLKASLEPRQIDHSGSISLTAKSIIERVVDAKSKPIEITH